MESPDAVALRGVAWQSFATLTFSSVKRTEAQLVTSLFSFLRGIAASEGLHWEKMLWASRAELGEKTGRFHYHVLIGGFEVSVDDVRCKFWERVWSRGLNMGIADIRVFDGRDAVDYILKQSQNWNYSGANNFEVSKFRQTSGRVVRNDKAVTSYTAGAFKSGRPEVTLSDSLRKRLHTVLAQSGLNRLHQVRETKKPQDVGTTGRSGGPGRYRAVQSTGTRGIYGEALPGY